MLSHYDKLWLELEYQQQLQVYQVVLAAYWSLPIARKKYGLEHNNNPVERYNGSIKDRTKTMRDFGSHEGAESFLGTKRIIHNFVNPHMSLKDKTPAEEAEVDLKLGRRKLLNLIRHVSRYHTSIR